MGIWKTLFSSGDTIDKTVDAVINAGDKLVFTDEEKSDMSYKMREQFIKTLEAYHPFKIAQRVLAFWYSFLFGIAFIVGVAMVIFNAFEKYDGLKKGIPLEKIVLFDIQPLINIVGAFSLGTIVLFIVIFYFGGGGVESFKAVKDSFKFGKGK